MKAILDHWVGNRSEDTEHTIVSTGELLALLKRLGTNHHTLLSLYHPSKDPDNRHHSKRQKPADERHSNSYHTGGRAAEPLHGTRISDSRAGF